MESMQQLFEEVLKSKNSERINDFLIKLSQHPNKEYLHFIDNFINKLDTEILKNVTINLVYLMGEIGEIETLGKQYLEFLEDTYYKSDRWVRNEIIQTLTKILKKSSLSDKLVRLIGYSLNDDYELIKLNSLKALKNFNQVPNYILKNVIKMLELKDLEIIENCSIIIKRHFHKPKQLYTFLNRTQNYKEIKRDVLRNLLITLFNSITNLESFREIISISKWEKDYKEFFINEIEIYEKILLKSL